MPIEGIEFENIDADKAIKACEDSVKNEPRNLRYLYQLGRAYYKKEEYTKAMELYQKAADKGVAQAQYDLGGLYGGTIYRDKKGVKRNGGKAVELYQKAADQGYVEAENTLGAIYEFGLHNVRQDYSKAVEYYKKASEKGFLKSYSSLAGLYTYGRGVNQDYKKAAKYYMKGADQGDAFSIYMLGKVHMEGKGVEQDNKKAIDFFKKISDKKGIWGKSALRDLNHLKAKIAEEERTSTFSYKASKIIDGLTNSSRPSEDTVISLATKYNISQSNKSDIEIIKSYEKDGKTVQILLIKDMVCEMPMLEIKGEWRALGITCRS